MTYQAFDALVEPFSLGFVQRALFGGAPVVFCVAVLCACLAGVLVTGESA